MALSGPKEIYVQDDENNVFFFLFQECKRPFVEAAGGNKKSCAILGLIS
jgi:hypothetical protein